MHVLFETAFLCCEPNLLAQQRQFTMFSGSGKIAEELLLNMLAGDERQGQSQLNLLKAQSMRHLAPCCVGNAENPINNKVCL